MSEIRVDTISEKTSANGVAIDGLTIKDGGITATTGAIVFNEASADLDFRVESNGNANMLFVDGGNNHVNIGTSSDLGGVLNVDGQTFIQTADNSNTLTLISTDADATSGPRLSFQRQSSSPADDDNLAQLFFTGKDSGGNNTDYASLLTTTKTVADGSENGLVTLNVMSGGTAREFARFQGSHAVIFNEDSQDIDFRVESNGSANMIFVDAGNDKIGINNASPARQLHITDTIANSGASLGLTSSDSSTSGSFGIIHFGNNTDSSLASIGGFADGATDAGALIFKTEATGGAIEERVRFSSSGAVFNEGSFDMDFRVESNANTHMLFVDGGNNSIGINNSTPASYDGGADDLVVGDHSVSSQGITIASDDNSILYFADGTSGDERYRGSIIYNHPADNFIIRTAGFNTRMTIDSTGAVTIPNQPAFSVKPSSNQVNIGNNDTIAFGTEIFDQNADFASNTFTAPVTGRYQFNFMIRFDDIPENLGYAMVDIVTSNREYFTWLLPGTSDEAIGLYSFAGSFLVDMDANDTAALTYQEGDGGTTGQADVSANNSYFSGYLVC